MDYFSICQGRKVSLERNKINIKYKNKIWELFVTTKLRELKRHQSNYSITDAASDNERWSVGCQDPTVRP